MLDCLDQVDPALTISDVASAFNAQKMCTKQMPELLQIHVQTSKS